MWAWAWPGWQVILNIFSTGATIVIGVIAYRFTKNQARQDEEYRARREMLDAVERLFNRAQEHARQVTSFSLRHKSDGTQLYVSNQAVLPVHLHEVEIDDKGLDQVYGVELYGQKIPSRVSDGARVELPTDSNEPVAHRRHLRILSVRFMIDDHNWIWFPDGEVRESRAPYGYVTPARPRNSVPAPARRHQRD